MGQNDRRLELHEIFCEVLGSRNVYFQPPNGAKLNYPCIIYKRDSANAEYADDRTYIFTQQYSVTCISPKQTNDIYEKLIERLPMIRYIRGYTVDNLSHDILNLFY